jgi:hypothetical protein
MRRMLLILGLVPFSACREVTDPASAVQAAAGPAANLSSTVATLALSPSIDLDTDQHFLNPGETSVLVWSAANGTSCRAPWTASRATSGSQAVTPASTTTYTITCRGSGGSTSASTTVNVINLTPAVGLDTDQHFLNPGETSVLAWTADRATSCSAPWTSSRATNGSQSVTPATTTTYTITCTGPGGSAQASTTVNVASAAPALGLDTDQHFLNPGETSVLVWTASNATSCRAPWTTSTATNGSQAVTPASTTTYTVTCTGPGGVSRASTTVNVANLNPTIDLDTDQHFLNPGETSVLVWSAFNATSCRAPWTTSNATSGSPAVTPASTTTYTLTCTGPGGSSKASTTVNVIQ